jgi:small subunit ribosomal protein S20
LAHSRSALKRWRQSLKRRARNRSAKARTRTLLTKALFTVEDDPRGAEAAVREAISSLDRAAQKGVIHRNAAARSKSRLLKRFNLATAGAVAAAAAAATAEPAPDQPQRRTRRTSTSQASDAPKAPPRPRGRRTSQEK